METKQFKDKQGNELHIGDKVRVYFFPNYERYRVGVVEKFTSKTVKVFINKGFTPYAYSEHLEIVNDDTIEKIFIKRKHLKKLLKLLIGRPGYTEVIKEIKGTLNEEE